VPYHRLYAVARAAHRAAGLIASLSILACVAPRPAEAEILDQAWVGGFAHDVSDLGRGKESNSQDIELELDTVRPQFLRFLGAPRLNATLALNASGLTDFGGVGLVWDRRLIGRLSGSIELGVDQTDGVTEPAAGPAGDYDRRHRLLLGSKTLFREAAGADWALTDRWSVGAEYVHLSNGGILSHGHNEGINDAGLRLGYRFR
jgi:lipid A 3-O-deacylase